MLGRSSETIYFILGSGGKSMLRTLGVVTALQLLAWTPAWACTGQVGAVVFQDTFSDDTGGWDETPPDAMVKSSLFVFALGPQDTGYNANNLTFSATDGDYCMDFILPPSIAANNLAYAGINFWAADYGNMMNVEVGSNGTVILEKETAENWSTVWTVSKSPAFLPAANAVNSLRITALGGLITVYLNGTTIKAVRAQEPTNMGLSFGMSAGLDTAVAKAPEIHIKSFSVTAGK
jgi:hypothetical protein